MKGSFLPAGVADAQLAKEATSVKAYKNFVFHKFDDANLEWYDFPNTAQNSPLAYVLQLPGFFIAYTFTHSHLSAFGARVSVFIFSLLLLYLAILKAPFKKKTFFLLALTPMFLQESVAITADSTLNIVSFLICAIALLYSCDDLVKLKFKDLCLMMILCIVLSLCKTGYVFIALLFLIVPLQKFQSVKQGKIFFVSLFTISFLLTGLWLLDAMSQRATFVSELGEIINTNEQLSFVIANPIKFVFAFLNSFVNAGVGSFYSNDHMNPYLGYIDMFMGAHLAWQKIDVNKAPLYIYLAFVFLTAISEKYPKTFNYRRFLVLAVCIFVIISSIIFVSQYLTFTPIGHPYIRGIQGRYFIPLAIMLFLAINVKSLNWDSDRLFRYALPVIAITHLFAFAGIMGYYCGVKG
jgi:uncharacterized membrane protein